MSFKKSQIEFLNQSFSGTEYCPFCDAETDFTFNPITDSIIVCEHCGSELPPCSLCDASRPCDDNDDCKKQIMESLIWHNELWDESVNGRYLSNETKSVGNMTTGISHKEPEFVWTVWVSKEDEDMLLAGIASTEQGAVLMKKKLCKTVNKYDIIIHPIHLDTLRITA